MTNSIRRALRRSRADTVASPPKPGERDVDGNVVRETHRVTAEEGGANPNEEMKRALISALN